jgi:hypothetical protein
VVGPAVEHVAEEVKKQLASQQNSKNCCWSWKLKTK